MACVVLKPAVSFGTVHKQSYLEPADTLGIKKTCVSMDSFSIFLYDSNLKNFYFINNITSLCFIICHYSKVGSKNSSNAIHNFFKLQKLYNKMDYY